MPTHHPYPVGKPVRAQEVERYERSTLLRKFGFDGGWVGPDPHGPAQNGTGVLHTLSFRHCGKEIWRGHRADECWVVQSTHWGP